MLNRILLFAVLGGLAWGVFMSYEANVRSGALAEYNKTQLELLLKEQERTHRIMDAIKTDLANEISKLHELTREVDGKTAEIEKHLNNPETLKQDRDSSPVLRDTFKMLGAPE